MAAPALYFSAIKLITILKGKESKFELDTKTIWKIESVGIGGATGTLLLQDEDVVPIAVLYSAANERAYGSQLPYWVGPGFEGSILNDSSFSASVSITIYTNEPPEG